MEDPGPGGRSKSSRCSSMRTGASTLSSDGGQENPVNGLDVIWDMKNTQSGTLVEGGPPRSTGHYLVETPGRRRGIFGNPKTHHALVDVATLALPLKTWKDMECFASTSGGGGALNLPENTHVLLVAPETPRGKIVNDGSDGAGQGRYEVALPHRKTNRTKHCSLHELAVPLEPWWSALSRTAMSWPALPPGTRVFHLRDSVHQQRQLRLQGKAPTDFGEYHLDGAEETLKEPLHSLVVTLEKGWDQSSASVPFETGNGKYPHFSAGFEVNAPAENDVEGTLIDGSSSDGSYEVYFPSDSIGERVSGSKLAVTLETWLLLHQITTLKQEMEKVAIVREVTEKQAKTIATLSKAKAECETERATAIDAFEIEKRKLTAILNRRKSDYENNMSATTRELQIERRINANLTSKYEMERSQDKDIIAHMEAAMQRNQQKERRMTAEMDKLKSECDKAKEGMKIAQGDRLMHSAADEHDYGSNLPSPADLVTRIERIQNHYFPDWIQDALDESIDEWMSEDTADLIPSERNFVLQVLVETARDCHRRVQECVSSRINKFTKSVEELLGRENARLDDDVAVFERTVFHKGYKEIFADLCPESPAKQIEMARDVFNRLDTVTEVTSKSSEALTVLFDKTKASYAEVVTGLVLTFLECEIRRSTPLRFSTNFASREAWNPVEYQKESFDPSYEEKLEKGVTQVQVVIPRLFWEKAGDEGPKTKMFETQASFVVLSD